MDNRELNRILNTFGGDEDDRLRSLPTLYYRVLKMRYYEARKWKDIGLQLGYSVRQLYRIRDAAIEELMLE